MRRIVSCIFKLIKFYINHVSHTETWMGEERLVFYDHGLKPYPNMGDVATELFKKLQESL